MDLSIPPPGFIPVVQPVNPDEERHHPAPSRSGSRNRAVPFMLPQDNLFDSSAPVAVDAGTEAALFDLKPAATLPLDEAIHRYAEDEQAVELRPEELSLDM